MSSKDKKRLKMVGYCLTLLLAIYLVVDSMQDLSKNEITYDYFISYVESGKVSKVIANEGKNALKVTLDDGTESEVIIPDLAQTSSIIEEYLQNGSQFEFKVTRTSVLEYIINIIKPFITTAILVIFMTKSIWNIGGSYNIKPVTSKVKFSDVAGIDEEREQLTEVVQFLKKPNKYTSMGAKIPKGILLNGEPGTGKTLLAKAIAGEAGVPFFEVTASGFEEKIVGVGASRIRKLFKTAKKNAPCIIFIDEFDAVAKKRYGSDGNYNEQSLNQLLSEMDGFGTSDKVIVLAATNHIEVLDPAIIRAGRFDRRVNIPMPDAIAREKILNIHAKGKNIGEEVSLKEVAKKTVGFSGADLAIVLNEAAIYAVNHNKDNIDKETIDEAIARVLIGLEKKNAAIKQEDRKRAAIHEAGHAIASAILRPEIKNLGISIVPRGKAGGYNLFDSSEEVFTTKETMEKKIQVSYGGRVAEEIVFKDISSGASNDLEVASRIAFSMVNKFAMYDTLLVKVETETKEYNTEIEKIKVAEAEEICRNAYIEVKQKMNAQKEVIIKLGNLLIEKESLSQEEIESFMEANGVK